MESFITSFLRQRTPGTTTEGDRKFGGVFDNTAQWCCCSETSRGWRNSLTGAMGRWGRGNAQPCPWTVGGPGTGSNFAEKDLGLLVGSKLNMSHEQGDDPSFPPGVPCARLHSMRNLTFKPDQTIDFTWACLSWALDQTISRGAFQPQPSCESVGFIFHL